MGSRRWVTEIEYNKMLELQKEGYTQRYIAYKLGRHKKTVHQRLRGRATHYTKIVTRRILHSIDTLYKLAEQYHASVEEIDDLLIVVLT